ncbi:MAG: hypothetical protein Q9185_004015 [Variospora sp. 1 TL-2023]
MRYPFLFPLLFPLLFLPCSTPLPSPPSPYTLTNCDSTPLPHHLPLILHSLHYILHALNSTPPHPALLTFFDTSAHAPFLHRSFHSIATGALLPGTKLTPTVHCTTPDSSVYQTFCFTDSDQSTPPHPVAGTAFPHHGLVALCPGTFTLPAFPLRQACPGVARVHHHRGAGGRTTERERFVDDGHGLSYTLFGVLIHELVHLYNPLDDGKGEEGEVYTAQGPTAVAVEDQDL